MSDTPPVAGTNVTSPKTGVFPKLGIFLLLFAITLLGLLLLSRAYILPRVAEVEVNGVRRSIADLSIYHADLLATVERQEKERDASVVPAFDQTFESLKEERRTQLSFPWILEQLQQKAQSLVSEEDAIHISALTYDVEGERVEVTGDVRNVGNRSMTVLALFATTVGRLPFVAGVDEPSFERLPDPVSGFHSPFTFSFVLR